MPPFKIQRSALSVTEARELQKKFNREFEAGAYIDWDVATGNNPRIILETDSLNLAQTFLTFP